MFARSTSISADPAKLDAGIDFIRGDVMPAVMDMDGCVGMSLVVDRAAGRAIVTGCWESEEAMESSDARVAELRARGGEIMGGEPAVDLWEIASMHRDHMAGEGSCCRITWGQTEDMDTLIKKYRDTILPMIEAVDGFCSASLFVDRGRGLMCATVTFDSAAALEASRGPAAANRARAAEITGMAFLDIGEYELLEHHLRIPELV